MRKAFLSLIKPPHFEDDEEKTRVAGILHIVFLSMLAGVVIFATSAFFTTPNPLRHVLTVMPFFLVIVSLWRWLHRGHVYGAGNGLVMAGWLFITFASAIGGGIRSPGISSYLNFIFVAGLLIQKRMAILYAVASIAAGYVMIALSASGILLPSDSGLNDFTIWSIFAITLGFTTLMILLVRNNFDKVLAHGRAEITKRKKVEEELNTALQAALEREQALIRAQESQAHLAALVESSEDAIISQNIESKVLSWNSGAERLYGYTAEEMIGQRLTDKFPPEQQAEGSHIYEHIMRGGTLKNYEAVRRRKDGTDIHVAMSVSPIRDVESTIIGISIITRDMTERKQMENRLREQNIYLTALHEVTLGLLYHLDTDSLLKTIVEQGSKLFGTDRGYIELLEPDSEEAVVVVVVGEGEGMAIGDRRHREAGAGGEVWRTGEVFTITNYGAWSGRIADDRVRSLRGLAAAPLKSGQQIIGIIGFAFQRTARFFSQDEIEILSRFAELASLALYNAHLFEQTQNEIAQRKRAEREIMRSRANLLAVIESTHDAIWSIDKELRLQTFNSRYMELMIELYGSVPHAGERMDERLPPERIQFWTEHYARALRGERFTLEHGLRVNQEWRSMDYSLNPIETDGVITGAVIFSRDITERKLAEAALKQSQANLLAIIESTDEAIWSVDEEFRLITFNSRYVAEFEGAFHKSPWRGQTLEERVTPGMMATWQEYYTRAINGERFVIEYPIQVYDEERLKEYAFNPILADDRAAGVVVYSKDITERKRTEEALRRSEATLQAIFNNVPQGIILLDKDRRILTFNKAADESAMVTTSKNLQVAKLMDDYLTDKTGFEALFATVLEGKAIRVERSSQRPDQSPLWFDVSYTPVMTERGEVIGVCLSRLDITLSKQAEEKVRESEARLRAISEATPIPIIINTLDAGITLYGNPALSAMLGQPLEKLIGGRVTNFYVYPSEREGIISELKTRRSLRNYEIPLKRADGAPFWVSLTSELITYNDEPCVLTGFYDITVRRRVEERERALTQSLRALLEATDELLSYDNLDTIYHRAVELAREKLNVERCAIFLLDPSKEYLWGTYGTDIHGNTTDERWLRVDAAPHTQKFKADGPKWHTNLENQQTTIENGHLKVVGVGWAVTTVIHTTAGAIGVFINDAAISNAALNEATQESLAIYCSLLGHIIESKLTEKAIQESLKEKEVLLKEVHHRVKNNMQVIVSIINLQSGYIVDPTAIEIFRDTQHRVRAMALVHEKLYQSSNLAQIDFRDYIEHLTASLFHSYSPTTSRVALRVEIGDVALGVDSAIPCGLIVNELVSNALKYAFPDNRQGELIVRLNETQPGWIEMSVADDGVGVPDTLDIRNTETLGMQLAHSLARQLNGTLELDRKHGSKFTLRFAKNPGR
jgi:PAS domain S-box-containing protein